MKPTKPVNTSTITPMRYIVESNRNGSDTKRYYLLDDTTYRWRPCEPSIGKLLLLSQKGLYKNDVFKEYSSVESYLDMFREKNPNYTFKVIATSELLFTEHSHPELFI